MNEYSYWIVFITAAFVINISPGPDILYILSQTFSHGKKIGFVSSLGVCTGSLFHITLVAFGLSAVLSTSVFLFMLIKYAGAAYLFYLGIRSFISKGEDFPVEEKFKVRISYAYAFRQGVLVDIFNPKVAMFFIAFIPQFIRPEHGSFAQQTFLLGGIIIFMAIPIEWAIVILADKISSLVAGRPFISGMIDKIAGTILISLGVNLILAKNNE